MDVAKGECIFCRSSNTKCKFKVDGSAKRYFSQCLSCKTYFLDPQPAADELNKAYSVEYYGTGEQKFSGPIAFIRKAALASRIRKLLKYAREPLTVLDIGCGDGAFLDALIKRGNVGYGTEISGKAAERAAKVSKLQLHVVTLSGDSFAANSFGAISMWHVFEHLTNPRETLEFISKWLMVDGVLQVAIPNIDSWQAKFFCGYWFHLDPPRHLSLYSKEALEAEFLKMGYQLMESSTLSFEQNIFGYVQSFLNLLLKDRNKFYEFLKGNHSENILNVIPRAGVAILILPLCILLTVAEAAFGSGGVLELIFKKRK